MNKIFLKRDGSIYINEYKGDRFIKSSEIKPLFLFRYFNEPVELGKKFTLRSYFLMVEKYEHLQLFDGFFESFIEEYKSCPESGCVTTDL